MKKFTLFICLLVIASCATNRAPQANPARDQRFKTAYKQIADQCKADRQKGIYKTRLETVQKCSKPKILKLEKQLNMPNKDLIASQVAESESLAGRLDDNEITQAEADNEYSNFMVRITEEERRRSGQNIK